MTVTKENRKIAQLLLMSFISHPIWSRAERGRRASVFFHLHYLLLMVIIAAFLEAFSLKPLL